MKFKYKAKDSNGENVFGDIESSSSVNAKAKLRQNGYKVMSIEAVKEKKLLKKGKSKQDIKNMKLRGKIKSKEIVLFCKEMVILLNAGIPILSSLNTIAEQTTNLTFKSIMYNIESSIRDGLSLSESFSRYPKYFSKMFYNMVRAGEESGDIVLAFSRLEDYYERIETVKKQVRKATTYPIIIVVVAVALVTLLLTYVVPTFVKVFQDAGAPLPALTQAVLNLSNFIKGNFILIIITLLVVFFVIKRLRKSSKGRIFLDRVMLKIPLINKLIIKIELSRFSRTMASLLLGGVPIIRAFEISEQVMTSESLRIVLQETRIGIREGKQIAQTLSKSKYIPKIMLQMIEIGEESGKLPDMFEKIAELSDKELEEAIDTVVAMIEPSIIVVLGGIIGVIILSIYLPILEVANLVGN